MTNALDAETLKDLYDQLADQDSASYRVWLKKIERLAAGNPRTFNAIARRLGVETKTKASTKPIAQFITYDGEGFSNKYVLLANSLGESVANLDGLSTLDCLRFLTTKYSISSSIRCFFSFGYDINHCLRDVNDATLSQLLSGRIVNWEGFRLSYVPGKIFTINGITYYDTFGFFQTSFLKVVKAMLGEEAVSEKLVEGKEARGSFETWDIERIIAYNAEELDLLVKILNKLRDAFLEIGVNLKQWYGPGAVAKYWFKQHKVEPHEAYDADTLMALSSAYYGGRFEQVKLGKIAPVYEYDIHSAYPAAMADMPYFTKWKKASKYRNDPYSIWYVSFDFRKDVINATRTGTFLPLPMRSKDGRICFPLVGRGWYWNSELRNAILQFPRSQLLIHKGYVATTEGKPFAWVRELYDYRKELKSTGNLSQYAIKVGLNSLYGKTAQRVGRNPYFSLAWAGYITSTTRAKLAEAGYADPTAIVGFATDALFSTRPLPVRTGDDLGEWDATDYVSGTFFQSGVYRLLSGDTTTDRYRGSPLRRGIDSIITQLEEDPYHNPKIKVGRFISHLLAIRAPIAYGPHRLSFVQVQHELALAAPYKRHYTGFVETLNAEGLVLNYGRLLNQSIESLPKIWMEDDNFFLWNEYLYGNLKFQVNESYPPPLKDTTLQRLIEEGIVASIDSGYDEVSMLDILPVVEDESM